MAIPIPAPDSCRPGWISCLAFIVLIGMMIYYQQAPSLATSSPPPLFPPWPCVRPWVSVCGWARSTSCRFADVRYVIPFPLQVWLCASPVALQSAFPANKGFWNVIYGLNLMAGVVNGFRWAPWHTYMDTQPQIIIMSSIVSPVLLVTGLFSLSA